MKYKTENQWYRSSEFNRTRWTWPQYVIHCKRQAQNNSGIMGSATSAVGNAADLKDRTAIQYVEFKKQLARFKSKKKEVKK